MFKSESTSSSIISKLLSNRLWAEYPGCILEYILLPVGFVERIFVAEHIIKELLVNIIIRFANLLNLLLWDMRSTLAHKLLLVPKHSNTWNIKHFKQVYSNVFVVCCDYWLVSVLKDAPELGNFLYGLIFAPEKSQASNLVNIIYSLSSRNLVTVANTSLIQ